VSVGTVRRSLSELRRPPHHVSYAYLGISSQDLWPQLAQRLGLPVSRGALVVKVEGDGPAKGAGIKTGDHKIEFQGEPDIPAGGDVIVGLDGHPVRSSSAVADAIQLDHPGQRVRIELVRGSKRRTVTVALGTRPSKPPQP
jgi:S1-C subfamily serine protease